MEGEVVDDVIEDDIGAEEEEEEEEEEEPIPEESTLVSKAALIPSASIDVSRVTRNILADNPRVTRYNINWD